MRIDCHNDTQLFYKDHETLAVLPEAQLDFARMKQYLDVAFFAVWVEQKEYAGKTADVFRSRLARLKQDIAHEGDMDILLYKEQLEQPKKPLILLCMEGAVPLGENSENLEEYFAQGLRAIGLTWNYDTPYAGGAMENGSLTQAGAELIKRCEKLGVVVDCAHLNDQSFEDILSVAKKPLLDSHTVCRHLCDAYPRSMTDKQMEDMAEMGGVACMAMVPDFLGGTGDLAEYCRHVEYAVRLIGADHVGMGADYDGTDMSQNLAGVQFRPAVYEGLRSRGLTEGELALVSGDSVAAMLKKVLPSKRG